MNNKKTSSRSVGMRDINAAFSASISRVKALRDNEGRRGFTLIELLVVILIIGILSAVALPQYQKAVLKSRFSSLMPTTQAIRDGNEMYYMTNGHYADTISMLDITTENTDDMLITVNDDDDYAYTMATRPNIKNNLIMYQKHSLNFPGEIHCEALKTNKHANWLCETALHGTQNLGEIISNGYNTYVIEGAGRGLNRAEQEAILTATTCDKAYATGATTCEFLQENTKRVCYSINGMNDYCISTEFGENNQITKSIVCSPNRCTESYYDEKGNKTFFGRCDTDSMSSDKKSCDTYGNIAEYWYDPTTGEPSSYKSCSGIVGSGQSSDGRTCDKYEYIRDYEYDAEGNQTSIKKCSGLSTTESSDGKTCDAYGDIYNYEYDTAGNQTSNKYCNVGSGDVNDDGKTCAKYSRIFDYEYDSATGNLTSAKSCGADNIGVNGKTCNSYDGVTEYEYDPITGNQTVQKFCGNNTNVGCVGLGSDGNSCSKYDSITAYGYDENGNQIYLKNCKKYNVDRTQCEEWYNPYYSYGD